MKFIVMLVILILNIDYSFSQKEYLHLINSNNVEFNYNTKDFKPITKNKYNLYSIYLDSDLANLDQRDNKFKFNYSFYGTICDKNGNLLLYSNGRHMIDFEDKLLFRNDKNINLDIFTRTKFYSSHQRLLTDSGGAVSTQILKKPGCNDEYYLFYTTHNYVLNSNTFSIKSDTLTYTGGYSLFYYNFEYTKQNGIKVLSNPIILIDSVLPHFTFCKSSNNIDIWLVTRKYREDTYLSFKFEDSGLSKKNVVSKFSFLIDSSYIDPNPLPNSLIYETYSWFNLTFSPNSKYLLTYNRLGSDVGYEMRLYSFDNLSGKLNNLKINMSLIDKTYSNNCTFFSPNSEYIYIAFNYNLLFNENKIVTNQYKINDLLQNKKQSNLIFIQQKGDKVDPNVNSGFYNRILHTTNDSNQPNSQTPKINLTEVFNTDSLVNKIKIKLNSIKSKYMYDTIWGGVLDGNYGLRNPFQRPLPGGYYGTDIYKEKCPKDSIRLAIHFELDEKDSLYEWTGPNGFTSKQRNPILYNVGKENQGWYDLKVYDPKIDCYRNFALHLEVKDTAEVEFIESSSQRKNRITFLKANESIKLFIPTNNYEKVWSTGETGDTIIVNKAGRYTLKLNTDRWCENVTYIDVVEDSVVVIAADDASFNQHKISDQNIVTKKVRINCESFQYDLKVYDYVNSNPDVFETNLPVLNGQTVIQFKPGGYYEFEVKFKPKEKRKYFDSIVFFSNARIIDNVTYLYGEGVDSIASVEDEPTTITDITQSNHIELYDILGRSIATFPSYEKLKAEIENFPPPHLIKWRDEKGIFHFEKMK